MTTTDGSEKPREMTQAERGHLGGLAANRKRSAERRREIARLGGIALALKLDLEGKPNRGLQAAREAVEARFVRQARQELEEAGQQPTEAHVRRRALQLRKLHYAQLALRSHAARRRNRGALEPE